MDVTAGLGCKRGEREHGLKLALIDVKRAYFYAKAKRGIFVKLPDGQRARHVRKIIKSMHGARDAASNWEDCYMDFGESIEFESGHASPCAFKRKARRRWLTVRGDDFTLFGDDLGRNLFDSEIREKLEVKA